MAVRSAAEAASDGGEVAEGAELQVRFVCKAFPETSPFHFLRPVVKPPEKSVEFMIAGVVLPSKDAEILGNTEIVEALSAACAGHPQHLPG